MERLYQQAGSLNRHHRAREGEKIFPDSSGGIPAPMVLMAVIQAISFRKLGYFL